MTYIKFYILSNIQLLYNYIYVWHGLTGKLDYKSEKRNVTFLAGTVFAKFDVKIANDDIFEGNETFSLHITPLSLHSQITRGIPLTAIVTIVDDEER